MLFVRNHFAALNLEVGKGPDPGLLLVEWDDKTTLRVRLVDRTAGGDCDLNGGDAFRFGCGHRPRRFRGEKGPCMESSSGIRATPAGGRPRGGGRIDVGRIICASRWVSARGGPEAQKRGGISSAPM
jgi:hypothetical protein